MIVNKVKLLILIPFIVVIFGIIQYYYDPLNLTFSPSIIDVRIYKDTLAWELAKAVQKENVQKIKEIVKENSELLNTQDPYFGAPLIYYAVQNEKYDSLKALLESGANPDIRAEKKGGETALFAASCFSAIDNDAKRDPKFVKLLLDYGANPNLNYLGGEKDEKKDNTVYTKNISPLMYSIPCGPHKTKLLYEAGADVFHKDSKGYDVFEIALSNAGMDFPQIVQFALTLIKDKKISLDRCRTYPTHKICLVDELRRLVFPLNSEKHKIKMQIVDEFTKQGVDYWSTPIPDYAMKQIKKLYPDTWQEYIKKY